MHPRAPAHGRIIEQFVGNLQGFNRPAGVPEDASPNGRQERVRRNNLRRKCHISAPEQLKRAMVDEQMALAGEDLAELRFLAWETRIFDRQWHAAVLLGAAIEVGYGSIEFERRAAPELLLQERPKERIEADPVTCQRFVQEVVISEPG